MAVPTDHAQVGAGGERLSPIVHVPVDHVERMFQSRLVTLLLRQYLPLAGAMEVHRPQLHGRR